MMDGATIRHLSDQAARKAARNKVKPFVFWDANEAKTARGVIPFIGSHKPKGWEKVEELFVDSSGFGSEAEPALTQRQFIAKVVENVEAGHGYGYAIVEAGQFQCYVGVFKPLAEAFEPGKSEGKRPRRK